MEINVHYIEPLIILYLWLVGMIPTYYASSELETNAGKVITILFWPLYPVFLFFVGIYTAIELGIKRITGKL